MLTYRADRGHINDWHVMNLGQFAAGGCGLVMMESTKIEPRGCSTLRDAGIWSDAFIPGLARIVETIHTLGAAAGIQLGHSGRKAGMVLPWEGRVPLDIDKVASPDGQPWDLIGPSPVSHGEGFKAPRALSKGEIADVIAAWTVAAARAARAGFDVVELHGAHGYLVHQFLSPLANQRTDCYGGERKNRMRFALELVEAVRAIWPKDRPFLVRVSAADGVGWELEDSIALSKEMALLGVDVVDCSSGGIATGSVLAQEKPVYGYQVPYAARIRAEASIKTMAVGLIVDPRQAEEILRSGHADLIAIGRELLVNPHWTYHAACVLDDPAAQSLLPDPYGYWLNRRGKLDPWRAGEHSLPSPAESFATENASA
jgi:2,4-dienoyl-CoA reductase-like NADH-dependent reductase (Old Yellow Enzyme family)